MNENQAEHSVSLMCDVLGLSRSGYYAWLKRTPSSRAQQDVVLLKAIREEHLASMGIYGVPRIHEMLRRRRFRFSAKRVGRLMREAGLSGVTRRKKWKTTRRDERARPAPDLVERNFSATGPNELWVADITHIPTQAGALYLAMVLDVWSRKVVGWAIGTSMPAELVIAALDMALQQRRGPRHVVHHSDQGSQYTSAAFSARCQAHGVDVSMDSVGDCFDNAMAESFFATLETEMLALVGPLPTIKLAKARVIGFIEGFYNTRRLHSSLGYRSPCEFEEACRPQPTHSQSTTYQSPPCQSPSILPDPDWQGRRP